MPTRTRCLYRIAHTDDDNLNNYGFYSNARVDELLEKAYTVTDVEERDAMYEEIAQIMLYDDPYAAYINLRTNTYVGGSGHRRFPRDPLQHSDPQGCPLRCLICLGCKSGITEPESAAALERHSLKIKNVKIQFRKEF